MNAPGDTAARAMPVGVLVIERRKATGTAGAFYAAKWRASSDGRQIKRRLGPAWLEADRGGGWRPRKGRVRDGFLDERRAHAAMAKVIEECEATDAAAAELAEARRRAGLTFRALAHAWLVYAERIKGVKPATLRDYRSMLVEPGTPHRRGSGVADGVVMRELGDIPAASVTVDDVENVLESLTELGRSPVTVNKYRRVLIAVFNYGAQPASGFSLEANPASSTHKRRERGPARLVVFSVEQVEALARCAADGSWRVVNDWQRDADTASRRIDEDRQLAELLRLACYTGLRRGELVTLRWRDVQWSERLLVVERALSAHEETAPKSGRFRYVPLADQALAALERLSRRRDFTAPDDYVFANAVGDRLDPSALRRRYVAAREAADLPPLRFHDLRHTAGSLLVRHLDPASVKDILGHADLKTTERYLHAQRASALATAATRAFTPEPVGPPKPSVVEINQLLDQLDRRELAELLAARAA